MCSVPESHLLAFGESGSEESSAERLAAAVMEVLGPEASSRRRFQVGRCEWLIKAVIVYLTMLHG